MIKITLIIPFKGFLKDTKKVFEEHNRFGQFYSLESGFEFELIEKEIRQQDLHKYHTDSDVIISRGFTAQILKSNQMYIPIVDIPVSGNDLIKAIHSAIKQYSTNRIAVIGAQNMIYGVEGLSEIFNINLKSYMMNDIEYSEKLVDAAIQDGYDTIIGGFRACQYALKKGINSFLIQTSKESFWQAITEAKRLAILHRKEKENTLQYKTMLESIQEGIISINNHNIITIFNDTAKNILNIDSSTSLIGKNINDVSIDKLTKAYITRQQNVEQEIIKINRNHYLLNTNFVYLNNNSIGKLINIQDVGGIQHQENSIRRKLYSKGHVAKYSFDDITYKSNTMNKTILLAKKYSKTDSSILIQGESGTGKEMFAQSIHNDSKRNNGPFVAVNCAALNESLLESTLFGYVEGAFTGASRYGKAGLFELAHNGTIFLDEIAEMPLSLQGKILRVLEEQEVMRLGDEKVIKVDVRIISATHGKLKDLIKELKFRSDLYYRLNVLNLEIPSLNNREEDVKMLLRHYIYHFSKVYSKKVDIHRNILDELSKVKWEGNIREIKNICERLVVICNTTITQEDIEEYVYTNIRKSKKNTMNMNTKESIYTALEESNFNKSKTAKKLGISRTTLWRYLNELNETK